MKEKQNKMVVKKDHCKDALHHLFGILVVHCNTISIVNVLMLIHYD